MKSSYPNALELSDRIFMPMRLKLWDMVLPCRLLLPQIASLDVAHSPAIARHTPACIVSAAKLDLIQL